MDSNKQRIVSHCEHSILWVGNLENLSEDQWRSPIAKDKWTVAEVIGHLIPWDKYFIERIPNIINEVESPSVFNIEKVNEKASIYSKNSSKEEIIKEFIEVRKTLLGKIRELNDELWEGEFCVGSNTLTLNSDLQRLVEHDENHFTQIKQLLA